MLRRRPLIPLAAHPLTIPPIETFDGLCLRAQPVLTTVVGSHAHGLATPTSDVDYVVVFAWPTEAFLGFTDFPVSWETLNQVGDPPTLLDVKVYEIGKFVQLAMKCNPSILEVLWTPNTFNPFATSMGGQLRDLRDAFLSEAAIRASYLGYAHAQHKKWVRQAKDAVTPSVQKNIRHSFRLLLQAQDLLGGKPLEVYVKDRLPASLDEMSLLEAIEYYQDLRNELDASPRYRGKVPPKSDQKRIEAFLRMARKEFLSIHEDQDD